TGHVPLEVELTPPLRPGELVTAVHEPVPHAAILSLTCDRRPPGPRRLLCRRGGAGGALTQTGTARGRRRPARPRCRRHRELRCARLRHPLGHELRRGAPPLPAGRFRAAAALALP